MENDVLGKPPQPIHRRDAIHIAIVPVVAEHSLSPGSHVAIYAHGTAGDGEPKVGIVDPFLTEDVGAGKPFWLLIYPNTITGMRHHWSHPDFSENESNVDESRAFMERCAAACGKTVEALLEDATNFAESSESWPDFVYDNSERYKDFDEWSQFPRHFEAVTGIKFLSDYTCPYTCSC